MIEAEVKMSNLLDDVYPSELFDWCKENFGSMARERDQISDDFPWTYKNMFSYDMWYFSKKEHATLFVLRWL